MWYIRFLNCSLARAGAKPPKPASARHSLLRFVRPRIFHFSFRSLYLKVFYTIHGHVFLSSSLRDTIHGLVFLSLSLRDIIHGHVFLSSSLHDTIHGHVFLSSSLCDTIHGLVFLSLSLRDIIHGHVF